MEFPTPWVYIPVVTNCEVPTNPHNEFKFETEGPLWCHGVATKNYSFTFVDKVI